MLPEVKNPSAKSGLFLWKLLSSGHAVKGEAVGPGNSWVMSQVAGDCLVSYLDGNVEKSSLGGR